jgi:hypothetical protein
MCCHKKIKVGTRMWIHEGFYRCISRPDRAIEDPLALDFVVQKLPLFESGRANPVCRVSGATINGMEAAGQLVILPGNARSLTGAHAIEPTPTAPQTELVDA